MKTIPIFISSDARYAPETATLIASIMENTDADVDFYILDIGLTSIDKKKLEILRQKYEFRLEYISMDEHEHLFRLPSVINNSMGHVLFAKFLVPYIKPELAKAIVLDADMIALGDIRELWETDMEGNMLAAVPCYGFTDLKQIYKIVRGAGMSPLHKYFSTGTLVIDLKKWREEEITRKIFEYKIQFNIEELPRWDEIILNILLEVNRFKILAPEFNMTIPHLLYYSSDRPYEHKRVIEEHFKLSKHYRHEEKGIVHFKFNNIKPWDVRNYYYPLVKSWYEIPYFRHFWYYMEKTPYYESERLIFEDKQVCRISTRVSTLNPLRELLYIENEKQYKRYRMLTAMTLGLIPAFSKKKNKYKDLIKNNGKNNYI